MAYKIEIISLKKGLNAKTRERKKQLKLKVSTNALTASAPQDLLAEMALEKRCINSLKPSKKRARKSDEEQIQRVVRSLREFKQVVPVLIDAKGQIIHGTVVVEAMIRLGQSHVWCAKIEHLSEAQAQALSVALNRIGECGEWDIAALGELLVEFDNLDIDLSATGFSSPELDILMYTSNLAAADDEVEPDPPKVPVSQMGDLWRLGNHLILCGDATVAENYKHLLAETLAHAVFTDCPWNIEIEGFVSGLGAIKHSNFKMAAGEMSPAEFAKFCDTFNFLCAQHLADEGVFFSCIDWRSVDQIIASARKAGLKYINMAVWDKGSGGMGGLYRSAYELIPVFCKGERPAVNNIALGKHGRDRTNVWPYAGANRKGSSANKALKDHPTPKPVEMVADALLDVTHQGDIVLDPFLGSGTTLLAAERTKRSARGIELDPAYVDVCIARWEAMTGCDAVLAETGLTFAETAEQRAALSGDAYVA